MGNLKSRVSLFKTPSRKLEGFEVTLESVPHNPTVFLDVNACGFLRRNPNLSAVEGGRSWYVDSCFLELGPSLATFACKAEWFSGVPRDLRNYFNEKRAE